MLENKNKGGRPLKVIDEDQVLKLASIGCTYEEIADWFNVSKDVLANRFADIIKEGHTQAKASIRRERLRIALDKSHKDQAKMLMFLSKVWLGEKEYAFVQGAEHKEDGYTIQVLMKPNNNNEPQPQEDS